MKKVIGNVSKFIFAAFGLAVLGLLMSLTYQALQRIFPTSFINQMWGLVLFDIGAICWALAFVFLCQTTAQYAVAVVGFLTGFIGTLLMVGAEVMLSGQQLVTTDQAQIGQWLIYGFIGATALHVTLIYSHHFTAPDIRERIDVGIARGEITSEAITQATKQLDMQKAELAHNITQEIVSQVKRDLGLMPVAGTPFEPKNAETILRLKPDPYPIPAEQPRLDGRPAIQVPEPVYQDLLNKYPTIPGIFQPQDEPKAAKVPLSKRLQNMFPFWKTSGPDLPTSTAPSSAKPVQDAESDSQPPSPTN